jgi:hypothetical protein
MNRHDPRGDFLRFLAGSALAVVLIAFIAFGIWAHFAGPCYLFDYTPAKDVPARCLMHR